MSTRGGVRVCALVGVTALVAAGTALLSAGTAHADTASGTNDNRYSLSAEGDGAYFYLFDGSLPATPTVDFSPYTAFAENNSQGASDAFAGLPYAGKTAETLPGTINGLAGGNFPPIPPLPGYVQTNYPSSKESTQTQGPYIVQAKSDEFVSSALAGTGFSPNAGDTSQQIFSTANVKANADGTVEAKATAGAQAIAVGPVKILNFSSTMTVTATGTGDPKVMSTTDLGTIEVLGFKLGIDQDGFTLLGDHLSLPTTAILAQINKALATQGFEVSVTPSTKQLNKATGQTTATSSELRITVLRDVPTQGPTKVVYTFGRATVSVADFAIPSDPVDGGTTGGDSSGGTTGADASTGASTGGVSGEPGIPTGPLDTGGSTGSVDVPPQVDSSTGGNPGTPTKPRTLGLNAVAPQGQETWALYLVLVLAGVGVVGGQQLFRSIGVRLALREA